MLEYPGQMPRAHEGHFTLTMPLYTVRDTSANPPWNIDAAKVPAPPVALLNASFDVSSYVLGINGALDSTSSLCFRPAL